MAEIFRFSPRENRAAEIAWRPWTRDAFDDAERLDRPILLNLTAVWCQACQLMDETTYSDEELIELINEETVAIRVDADTHPHVQDRYIAGGWPTNAFLSPTGEVLWSGTYVEPAQFRAVARGVIGAWRDKRDELRGQIEGRRRALEAARARNPVSGLVRRSAADDVLAATQDSFDPRNGGFGTEPKFPPADAIEPLFVQGLRTGNPDWVGMAERTLDGMIAGEVWDAEDGGFFRYALRADWTEPRREKILETNAATLRAYALGARLLGRDDWRGIADRTVAWADTVLRRDDGFWAASQVAAEDYFRMSAGARRAFQAPATDPILYTAANAQWIRALAEAGAGLGRDAWVADAAGALERLLATMAAPGDLLYHFCFPGAEPELCGLLLDQVETALACVAVAQATGRTDFLDHARRLAGAMEREFWVDENGGFCDHLPEKRVLGALRYRDRPFELNALAARLFLDLVLATGERGYRAIAERVLAVLSPLAGRYGVGGTPFSLAVEEFFDPPLRVVLVGTPEATAELRRAAFRMGLATCRVWTMPEGGRIGAVSFPPVDQGAAAYVCGSKSCSPPVLQPDGLEDAARAVV